MTSSTTREAMPRDTYIKFLSSQQGVLNVLIENHRSFITARFPDSKKGREAVELVEDTIGDIYRHKAHIRTGHPLISPEELSRVDGTITSPEEALEAKTAFLEAAIGLHLSHQIIRSIEKVVDNAAEIAEGKTH